MPRGTSGIGFPKQRNALRGVGWQPGPLDRERDARGRHKDRNASGIDFFFMHRHMLHTARSMQDLPSWRRLPLPGVPLAHDRVGFLRYFDNPDGCSVPPAWVAVDDDEYTEWLRGLKATRAITPISWSGSRNTRTRNTWRN